MHHLTLEELARLVDEAPTGEEQSHLDSCERCAFELDALTLQTGILGQLPDPEMPLPLQRRIKEAVVSTPLVPVKNGGWGQEWLRAAAGVALFLFGAAVGTFGVAPRLTVAETTLATSPSTPASPEQAAASLAAAEAEYLRALSETARYDLTVAGTDPLNRLVALEGIVITTGEAPRQAPADPVINNYHLTALGQRDALLRQLRFASDSLEWF